MVTYTLVSIFQECLIYFKLIMNIMKKNFFLLLLLCLTGFSVSNAEKYFTRTAKIHFVSETKIIDIAGTSDQAISFLNIENGDIVFGILIQSFKFDQALAEEHFNENYMESDDFPKAKFKGKITNLSDIDFKKNGIYKVKISGKLTIHGVTKEIVTDAEIIVKGQKITGKCKFKVDVYDYGIEIPEIVSDKVNRIIPIEIIADYEEFKR